MMLEPRDFALRIFVALVLGTFIGAERQWRRRLAHNNNPGLEEI
jgi:uncharacterized membrane protein YhiD involved in acid resistance